MSSDCYAKGNTANYALLVKWLSLDVNKKQKQNVSKSHVISETLINIMIIFRLDLLFKKNIYNFFSFLCEHNNSYFIYI